MHDFIALIFYMFRRAVPPALIGLAVGAALLVPLNRKRRREEARFPRGQAAAILLLLCYLGGLASVTFMNRMESGMGIGIQLRPFLAFWEARNAFTLQVWLNPLLNVAMFLPLGVLLPLSVKRFQQWYWMLAVGAGMSLVIEGLQHILSRGQADVDDLICNTLGAMLGYCLVMHFLSLKRKRWKCAGAYAALPVLSIAALAGVFLAYHFQPYGNLADAPIYAANTKGVEWVQECALSDEPGPSGVYWAEPFTKESCDAFAAESVVEDGVLTDGELTCRVAEDGILFRIDNALSVSALQGDATVISPLEAYQRLCAGRFSWRDVPMFDALSPERVRVTACNLEYLTDSKGFRQPVYMFTLSDDRDAERGGSGWSTFVPALSGT